jgi:hypothetical protein
MFTPGTGVPPRNSASDPFFHPPPLKNLRCTSFRSQIGACRVDVIEEQGVFKSGENPQEALEPEKSRPQT